MAKEIEWHFNVEVFNEIRNSKAVQDICLEKANLIKKNCGSFNGSYEADVRTGRQRCIAMVKTTDKHAARANLKRNVLAKALGGALS